ncbi:MAG: hypothetical protein IBX68_06930 [Dehalococcoidia bacterium]|nr:hypothetical protein [Dehalococcoidia bacterium]
MDLCGDGEALYLEVTDTGKGFDPLVLPASSSGLRGMRARAQSVGGSLKVESAPGKGTRVIAELPVSSGANSESSCPAGAGGSRN